MIGEFVLRLWTRLLGWVGGWPTVLTVGAGLVVVQYLLASNGLRMAGFLWVVLAVVLWFGRHLCEVQVWAFKRRRLLAKHSTAAPPMMVMAKDMWMHKRRVAYVQEQWNAFCAENQLTGFGKRVPKLGRISPNVDLDLVARINPGPLGVTGGMAPFRKKANDIAVTCGCPGGVRFRETSIGRGTVTFMWSDLLARELPVAQMPVGPYDRIAYGITDGGDVMSIRMALAAFIIGMSGSGKSKLLRDLFVDLKRKNVRTFVYAIDPKRQELSKFAPLINQARGSLEFKGYTNTVDGAAQMIAGLVDVMHTRQDEMSAAGHDEWEEKHAKKWPLILVAFDEVLELMATWKPDPKTKVNPKDNLVTILSQCRAAGIQPILLSQVAHKEILGLTRSLVPQRVVLQMESALETGMAFGDTHAEDKGARCSEIHEPGMGYQWSAEVRGYAPFRAALVGAEDWERVLAGDELPAGMLEKDQVVAEPYFNYRFYTADRQPLRTGITNNFERRYKEYRASWEKETAQLEAGVLDPERALHQWFPFHDPAQIVVTEAKDKADAKAIESALIATGVWRGNHQENMKASLRNLEPPMPEKRKRGRTPKHAPDEPAEAAVEPPSNVTPIRRRPVRESETITRRRRA